MNWSGTQWLSRHPGLLLFRRISRIKDDLTRWNTMAHWSHDDLPLQNGDFPVRYASHNHRVILKMEVFFTSQSVKWLEKEPKKVVIWAGKINSKHILWSNMLWNQETNFTTTWWVGSTMQQAMCKWDIANQKQGYLPQKNGVSTNSIGFVIEPPGLKMCLSVEASIMEHHDDKSTGCENVKQPN